MADQPVYVTCLEIENVRCFGEKQVLGLTTASGAPAMWTTVLGENGTGKTTLMKMLALTATYWRIDSIPLLSRPQVVARTARKGTPEALVRVGVDLSTVPHDATDSDRVIEARWGPSQGPLVRSTAFLGLVPPLFAYGASRLPSATALRDRRALRGSTLDSLMKGGATLLNAEEWLLRLYFDLILDPGGPAERQYDAVRRALVDILPDVSDIPDPRRPDKSHRPGDLEGRVRFVTPDGEVAFDDLSLGYQTMTAWVVDLAARLFDHYPESADPLREPAIVLVDEIDLHLHPRWQRDLVRWLRTHFPRVQFVVTAHSPLVVLRRSADGKSVVIDNDPEIVRGWRVDQILTSSLYDLESARSKDVEERLARRQALATKKRRTKKEQAELDDLDAWSETLPTADRREDQEALDALRAAAALLVSDRGAR